MFIKKFNSSRNVLINEIQDFESKQLIKVLSILDDIHISFIAQEFVDMGIKVEILRDGIFHLGEEKNNR